MPFPGGEDQRRSLRPRPANCSPAMIIACGSESSFSMHSFTIRRATRFVEATRGMTASDSSARRRGTISRVSRWITASLILLQLLQSRTQFGLPRARLLDDVRGSVADELLVGQLRIQRRELLLALLDLPLRPLDLLLRSEERRVGK